MRTTPNLSLAVAAAGLLLTAVGASCMASPQRQASRDEAIQQARQTAWSELRRQQISAAERDSAALVAARAELAGQKTTIPKDAAVCFAARERVDRALREAMQPGREYGPELETWHAERRAVNQFCAYTMTIGAEG